MHNHKDMTLTLINEEERPERIAESLKKIELIKYSDIARTQILQREGAQAVDQLIADFTEEQALNNLDLIAHRSEERRVGKECRL